MIRFYFFFVISVFFSCHYYGQVKNTFYEEFRSVSVQSRVNEEPFKFDEFIEEDAARTLYCRTYKTSKGDIKSEYSVKPLCFKKNGKLEPIISVPTKDIDGSLSAMNQPVGTKVKSNGEMNIFFESTDFITISSFSLNGNPITLGQQQFVSNNKTSFELSEGISKSIAFIEGGFKVNYILHNSNSLPSGDFLIKEKLEIPDSWNLYIDNDEVHIHDGTKDVGFFGQILCFDQNFDVSKGTYSFEKENETYYVSLKISSQWLHGNRSFPIIIDPVVAGITSQWTGGSMPSCFMPTYNKDSLLVTIPGGVTITGIYVSSSFYADPFTPATMGIGSMNFSTNCASSQYFTITGALANSPGTAYLDSFNLMNPLSCCYSKSCNDTSIYVRFHLGRNALGTGCNTTYIRYDQFTQYPFKVVVYGKTPEPYGNEWYVPQAPICSNVCEFTATGYARYGVPPYTFTHPWSQDTVISGDNIGCNTGNKNNVFTLINPNCPIYCDSNFTELPVPPPIIYDACGTQILNIPIATKPIIPASQPVAIYDSTLCEGVELNLNLASCLNSGIVNYFGNGISGQGNINELLSAVNDSITIYNYYSFATINGCTSDTLQHNVYIIPNPNSNFTISPNPCVVEMPFTVLSNSSTAMGIVSSNYWILDNSFISSDSLFSSTISIPGIYPVCLTVSDIYNCTDTTCQELIIIPAEIENLNIITPNNDYSNDVLYFDYLDSYEATEILIFNRWGNLVYQASPYLNDWSGEGLTDGVYFYILKIKDNDKTYSSFFHLIR